MAAIRDPANNRLRLRPLPNMIVAGAH